jgi:uncharacterized membrane protein YiaA
VERTSGVGEPVAITVPDATPVEAFVMDGATLAAVPLVEGRYRLVPANPSLYTVILKDGRAARTFPLEVITRTNVIRPSLGDASDGTNAFWYGFVRTEDESLLALPDMPGVRDAALLTTGQRLPLSWLKEYVSLPAGLSGFIEVRRSLPSVAPRTITETPYGLLVGGVATLRFENRGLFKAFDNALEEVPVYYHTDSATQSRITTLYTRDQTVALVRSDGGSVTISEPVKEGAPITLRFDTRPVSSVSSSVSPALSASPVSLALPASPNPPPTNSTPTVAPTPPPNSTIVETTSTEQIPTDTTLSVYTPDGALAHRLTFSGLTGERTLPLPLPPGRYLATVTGATSGVAPLRVYGENPSLLVDQPLNLFGAEGMNLTRTYAITNGDLSRARTVQFFFNENTTTLPASIAGADSDGDGLVDRTIPPGATERVTATFTLPLGRSSASATFTAQSEELLASVTDTIIIATQVIDAVIDVDVVTIAGEANEPVVEIYSRAAETLPATVYVTGPLLSTQQTVLLEPGMNSISLPATGNTITVRVQVNGDVTPENNIRTRRFDTPPGTLRVFVSERYHDDHNQYVLETPSVPGMVLVFIDENGVTVRARAFVDGSRTLWDLGPVSANTEFTATLVPGEPEPVELRTIIDNNNPLVVRQGTWAQASTIPNYYGFDYLIDLNLEKTGSVTYAPRLVHSRYEVRAFTPQDQSLATDATLTVYGKDTTQSFTLNQQQGGWQFFGLHELDSESTVAIANRDTTRFVVADAVSFTPLTQRATFERRGNATLRVALAEGETILVPIGAYVDSNATLLTLPAPADAAVGSLNVTIDTATMILAIRATRTGTVRLLVSDGVASVTIIATIEAIDRGLDFDAPVTLEGVTVLASLAVPQFLEPDVLAYRSGEAEALSRIIRATGGVFDAVVTVRGKTLYLEGVLMPDLVVPLTSGELTEDRRGDQFLLDGIFLNISRDRVAAARLRDIADGNTVLVCRERERNPRVRQQTTTRVNARVNAQENLGENARENARVNARENLGENARENDVERSTRLNQVPNSTIPPFQDDGTRCRWTPIKSVVNDHYYTVPVELGGTMLAEATALERTRRVPIASRAVSAFAEQHENSNRGELLISASPRYARQGDGFVPINTVFTIPEDVPDLEAANARVEVGRNTFKTTAYLESGEDMLLIDDGKRPASISVPQRGVRGKANRNEVRYENLAPATDLLYSVEPGRIKQYHILKDVSANRTVTSSFRVSNADVIEEAGKFVIVDRTTLAPLWYVIKPFAYDQRGADDLFDGRITLSTTVQVAGDVITFTSTVPDEWAENPKRVYPIVVDPTISSSFTSGDGGYISQSGMIFPDDDLWVGEMDTEDLPQGDRLSNGFVRLALASVLPRTALIRSANASFTVQSQTGWDAGSDWTVFSFLNATDAASFWLDSFRDWSEYGQTAINPTEIGNSSITSGTASFTFNTTAIQRLQDLLVRNQERSITFRAAYLPSKETEHQTQNERISWYTGDTCCSPTGTVVAPVFNVTYTFENDTPWFTTPTFNQTTYNTTQNIRLNTSAFDLSSDLALVQATLRNPTGVFTNVNLSPVQNANTLSVNVSSSTYSTRAQNRSSLVFFDDFNNINTGQEANYGLWEEAGVTGNSWLIDAAQLYGQNFDFNESMTTLPPLNLSNADVTVISFYLNKDPNNNWDPGECYYADLLNGTAVLNLHNYCGGGTVTFTPVFNITNASFLVSNAKLRFTALTSANGEEIYIDNVNVTAFRSDREYNDTAYILLANTSAQLRNLTGLTITVQVTAYDPRGSANRSTSNTRPDIHLDVWNGTNWMDIGALGLGTTYVANISNTTPRNFSITTTDGATLRAWENASMERNIRVRVMNMDFFNSTARDEVNFTLVLFNVSQTGTSQYEHLWLAESLTTLGRYNLTAFVVNDTAGNSNSTTYAATSFNLTSIASVAGLAVPGAVTAYPEDVNFSCTVTDSVFETPIPNYNVSIRSNVTGHIGTFVTNSTGGVSTLVSITERTLLTCYISDRLDLFYYANPTNNSRIVAIDNEAPQWSLFSVGIRNTQTNLSDNFAVNRTNTSIEVRSYWTDDVGIAEAFLENNGSGTFENYTITSFTVGSIATWINRTLDFSNGDEFTYTGPINITGVWAQDFAPNANVTQPSRQFFLWGLANVTGITLSPPNPAINENTVATCSVTDWFSIPVSTYAVQFYRDSTNIGSAQTDSFGDATLTFATSSVGSYNVSCNITDSATDYYQLLGTNGSVTILTVTPDSTPPKALSITAHPTTTTLGENVTLTVVFNETGIVDTVAANITLPAGSLMSTLLTSGANNRSGNYTVSSEGLYRVRITANDTSENTGVSGFTHFIASGKAATRVETLFNRYNSFHNVTLNATAVRATADLEPSTRSMNATVVTTQVQNISPYFSSTGSCAGTTQNLAGQANSCRRAGQNDNKLGKLYGHNRMTAGYNGSAVSSNEIVPIWQFNLSGVPDDAAFTNGSILLTTLGHLNLNGGGDTGDTFNIRMHPASIDTIWDSNGPELSQLQSLSIEATVGTVTNSQMITPGTYTYVLSQANLDLLERHLSSNGASFTIRPGTGIGANEYVWWGTGFNGSTYSQDPELRLNYTTPTVDQDGATINYTDVLPSNDNTLVAIRINVTISGTDFRGSNYSVYTLSSGSMPILAVRPYNGTDYDTRFACDILTRGIGLNTTTAICSVIIRDSTVLSAWATATNRDVQLQALNLDNRNEGIDTINWTAVTVELWNGSALVYSGSQAITANLTFTIERQVGAGWVWNATVRNASASLTSGSWLNLTSLWNTIGWNVSDRAEGVYRAAVRLVNATTFATIAQGDGTIVEAFSTFTVNDTVPPAITLILPPNNSIRWGQNASGLNFTFQATDATGFTNCSLLLDGVVTNTTTTITSGVTVNLIAYNIAEGNRTYTARCFDNATAQNQNTSTQFFVFIDNTAPTVSITSPVNQTNTTATFLNVTANLTDNVWSVLTWNAYLNGVFNQTGTIGNASNLSVNFTPTIPEGVQTIVIEAVDGTGLRRNSSLTVTFDRTPPAVAINTPNNTWYNTTTPAINITLIDNLSTVINYTLYIRNVANTTGSVSNNTLTLVSFSQVPQGNYSVQVQGRDQAGNAQNSTNITILVDLNAPIITLNEPVNELNTTATSILFNWTYVDALSSTASCTLRINDLANTTLTALNNTWRNTTVTGFTDGRYNWSVSCIDIAGNANLSARRNFTIDRVAPIVNLVTPLNTTNFTTTRNVTLVWNATEALTGLASCQLFVNGTANATNLFPANNTNYNFNLTNLTNGAYTWQVRCNDTAGNQGNSTAWNFTIAINATMNPPSSSVIDRDGADSVDPDVVTLTAQVGDNESGVSITFLANLSIPTGILPSQTGLIIGTNTTNSTGGATLWFDANSSLYAGQYVLYSSATRVVPGAGATIRVMGSVNTSYASTTVDPRAAYNTSQTVVLAYNITSNGPENRSTLNATYGMNLSANITQPSAVLASWTLIAYNGSNWNGSYTLASNAEIGIWNVSGRTNATYFYNNTTTIRQFSVTGFANALSPANETRIDRDGVDPIDPDFVQLVIQIPGATQAYTVNFTADLADPPGIPGQTNILIGQNTTNSTGHAVLWWNPNGTLYAGRYTWYGISAVSSVNATLTVILLGGINNTYANTATEPNSTYFQNDTFTTSVNVTSFLGPESRADLNTSYFLNATVQYQNTTGQNASARLVFNASQWGNTTVGALFLQGVGVWNTSVRANSTYHYANSTNRTFTVFGYMNVTNISTPTSVIAYQNTSISCTVRDMHTHYPVASALVWFYRNGTLLGSNTTNSSGSTSFITSINTTGVFTFLCNISDQPGIYYYVGSEPNASVAVTATAFPITMAGPANDSRLDRDSYDPVDVDTIELNVTVPSYIPNGIAIDFRINLTAPANILPAQTAILVGNNTTTNGIARIYWNPNETVYAGNWTIYVNATSGVGIDNRYVRVLGAPLVLYAEGSANPNAAYNKTQSVGIVVNVTSSGPENRSALNESYTLSVNSTLTNTTLATNRTGLSYNDTTWNGTHVLTTLGGVGVWNVTINASGTYWYHNATRRAITVYGFMNVTSNVTSPLSMFAFQSATTTCSVQDTFDNRVVSGASVQFWRNGTFLGANNTNATGATTLTYSVNTTGVWTITCNVSDQPGIFYYRGNEPERNTTLTVLPFPVTITAPVNGTRIDRDSVSPADPDFVELNATVPSYVSDGVNILFWANLTLPSSIVPAQVNLLLGNNTTSSGVARIYWNPNATVYAGNYTLFANSSAGIINGTRNGLVIGSLSALFASVVNHPNASYNESDTALLEANLTSGGPENRTSLGSDYLASLFFNITNPATFSTTSAASYTDPLWNATFTFLTVGGVGNWSFYPVGSATYFYSVNGSPRNATVYRIVNATNLTLNPSSPFAYQATTATCAVINGLLGTPVVNYTVRFIRNGTNILNGTTNVTGHATASFTTNITGTYTVTCGIEDNLTAFSYARQNESNATLNVLPYPLTPVAPLNDTRVDRDGVDSIDPDVIYLNATVPAGIPDGILVTFQANLTDPSTIVPSSAVTNVVLGTNTTAAGLVGLWWNPNATVYAGNWTWWSTESQASINGTRTLLVFGALNLSFAGSTRPNASYNRTDTIVFEMNLTTVGGIENRSAINSSYGAGVTAQFTNTTGSTTSINTAFFNPLWNGSSPLSSLLGVGVWNVTANASARFLYPNATNRTTIVYGFMNVTSNVTSPSSMFAFQSATTSCSVQDQHSNYQLAGVVVQFWRNGTFLGTNNTNATGATTLTYSVNTTGVWMITCNISDQPNIFYYRGSEPERNTTLTVLPFSITPLAPANDTALDRDSVNATLADETMFTVGVPAYVPDGTVISFTASLTNPVGITPSSAVTEVTFGTNTTSGGTAQFTWNPNATVYAGNWTWWGASAQGTQNGSRSVLVYGGLVLSFSDGLLEPGNQTVENATMSLRFNLTSLGPENRTVLNGSYAAGVNASLLAANGSVKTGVATFSGNATNGTWNALISPLPPGFVGVWNVSGSANATYFLPANVAGRNTTVFGYANVTSLLLTPNPIDAYNIQVMTCLVRNQHTHVPVAGMNVTFWQNSVFLGSNLTNASGDARITHQQSVQGLFTVVCNITDQPSILYYAGDARNASAVANVTPILFTPVAPENGTRIDRDASGFGPVVVSLNGSMLAGVPDGIVVDFWANLTDPIISGQSELYLGNNTTSASTVTLWFNPGSTWYAGAYTWLMNNTGGVPNGSRTFTIMGSVNITNADGSIDPLAVYNDTTSLNVSLNVSSFGLETITQLNSTYGLTVNVTFTRPGGLNTTRVASSNGSQWRTNLSLQYEEPGVWNTSALANATYFYPVPFTTRNFTVFMVTQIAIADIEELAFLPAYANNRTLFVANYTNSSNGSVIGATCNAAFYDRVATLAYNASSGLYESEEVFSVEAFLNYTVTCTRPFHYVGTARSNVTMRSFVNATLAWNVTNVASDTRHLVLNLTNLQNYTENDLLIYAVVPLDANVTWQQTPTANVTVTSGEHRGLFAEWYVPSLAAGASLIRNYTVVGSLNVRELPIAGLRVKGVNTTIVLSP